MSDLYLIAHKVRNEPAFDVAERMECPECNGHGDRNIADATFISCTECDSLGYWYIIPTSGHRAYPFYSEAISIIEGLGLGWVETIAKDMPDSLPDHYHHTSSPATIRTNLLDMLAKLQPPPTVPFKRRF